MIAQEKCTWGNILQVPTSIYTKIDYTRKDRKFLHIFDMTPYNLMNDNQLSFSLISYA